MSATIALNGQHYFGETADRSMDIEQKALDFFRRADTTQPLLKFDGRNNSHLSVSRPKSLEKKASDFLWRADLSDTLETIWGYIKHQRISTLLKLIKAVALITAVILLAQGISITGFLALAGTIAGLLFAAVSNVIVWLLYIPIYFVMTPDFASSIALAVGLAWLAGISPFFALVLSPLILFGFRLADDAEWAQARVSEIPNAIGKTLANANPGATVQQVASNAARIVSGVFRRNVAKSALLPQSLHVPI